MQWLGAIGVLLLCGCGPQREAKTPVGKANIRETKPPHAVDRRIATAHNEFAFDLLHQLNANDGDDSNLVVSPLSVSVALSMVYNGASGATQKAMAKTLGFGNRSLDEINRANASLLFNLQSTDPKIETRIANSLWAREGITFEKQFLERCRKYYNAQTTALDLSTSATMDAINSWVAEQTQGKIARMADSPYDPQTRLVLLDAVYFKGKWQDKFEKSKTRDGDFHLQSGGTRRVPMMNRDGEYSYRQDKTFSAVALPYGAGNMSLVVLLPNRDASLTAVLEELNARSWSTLIAGMEPQQGHVALPRFKLEYGRSLNDVLSALGMDGAFSGSSDFGAMTKQVSLFLSQVRHKAVIEVNEEGTEAAAVTEGLVAGAVPAAPFQFIVDHPFFAALRDNRSGSVLFFVVVRGPR
jgi:serpin B